jgi:hypothetical protein
MGKEHKANASSEQALQPEGRNRSTHQPAAAAAHASPVCRSRCQSKLAQIRVMQLPNPIPPSRMTAPERLAEIAEILAAGLMRLRARQSTHLSPDCGESSLDCPGNQSGHADPNSLEVET